MSSVSEIVCVAVERCSTPRPGAGKYAAVQPGRAAELSWLKITSDVAAVSSTSQTLQYEKIKIHRGNSSLN
jgi:hypothetical protein